jgi:membrane protease YdiL (CAAX protease family)
VTAILAGRLLIWIVLERLAPGLFAQAGIAEEATFRGYPFHRLRKGGSFWLRRSFRIGDAPQAA